MKITCSNCKFWCVDGDTELDGDEGRGLYTTGVGEARWVRTFHVYEEDEQALPHRRCLLALHANRGKFTDADSVTPMLLLDGSGYTASLYTLPTFSCSAFVKREEK